MAKDKRFLTARESEREMQDARETNGFVGKVETGTVNTLLETAKQNCRLGDKLLMVINPMYVHIPEWQRNMDAHKALAIGSDYNSYKWELPKILVHRGKFVCVDGQHRIYGAFKGSIKNVAVEILEMSMVDAIELFLGQSADRRRMSPSDVYRAAIAAKIPEYLKVKEICARHNVQIKNDDSLKNPVGVLTSISDIVNMNPQTLDSILDLINKLNWNGVPANATVYGSRTLRVLKKLYSVYGEARTERALRIRCKGATYYKDNLQAKSQSEMFDRLAEQVERAKGTINIIDLDSNVSAPVSI